MTEDARQRIVVDAISFGQIFRFHHLLKSIVHAMQPPRLVVALLTVFLLVGGGKVWDWLFDGTPTFGPAGVLVTEQEQVELSEANITEAIRQMVTDSSYANSSRIDETERLNPPPAVVREWVTEDFTGKLAEAREVEALGDLDQEIAAFREKLESLERFENKTIFRAVGEQTAESFVGMVQAVFTLDPDGVFYNLRDLLVRMPVELWRANKPFCIFFGLYALIVLAVGGGALCRMSACEYAGKERLRASDGLMFATGSWVKLVLAPVLPLVIVAFLALLLIAAGTIFFNIPYLQAVLSPLAGLFYPLALLLGLLIAFVLLVLAGGFPLMLPAVAVENCGPADAMQRAYAYFLGRPFHMLGYVTVMIVGMAVGYIIVAVVASTVLNVTGSTMQGFVHTGEPSIAFANGYSMFDLTPPSANVSEEWYDSWTSDLIDMWQGVVVMLVVAWVVSFFFSSATVLYLLMRKAVDDQDPSEIWRPGLLPGTMIPVAQSSEPVFPAPAASADAGGEAAAESDDQKEEETQSVAESDTAEADSESDDDQREDEGASEEKS